MSTLASMIHPGILQRFQTLLQKGRLGHAYLFLGPRSVGKAETALAVAQLLVCDENGSGDKAQGCGVCSACRKIAAGRHPDVMVLNAGEEASIKIAAVREVIQRLQLRPFEARKKIVIIKDIELMTAESSNAFLKTLEEPPKDTVLLLTTASAELILPTVKSRCQNVYFFPVARAQVLAALAQDGNTADAAQQFLAYYSNGCCGRARQLSEEQFFQSKNTIIDGIVLAKNNDAFLKAILGDKDQTRVALEVLLTWFRDLVFVKVHAGAEQLIHGDRSQDLYSQEKMYSLRQLNAIIAGIEQALKLLDENLNVKISFYLLMEKIWVRA